MMILESGLLFLGHPVDVIYFCAIFVDSTKSSGTVFVIYDYKCDMRKSDCYSQCYFLYNNHTMNIVYIPRFNRV